VYSDESRPRIATQPGHPFPVKRIHGSPHIVPPVSHGSDELLLPADCVADSPVAGTIPRSAQIKVVQDRVQDLAACGGRGQYDRTYIALVDDLPTKRTDRGDRFFWLLIETFRNRGGINASSGVFTRRRGLLASAVACTRGLARTPRRLAAQGEAMLRVMADHPARAPPIEPHLGMPASRSLRQRKRTDRRASHFLIARIAMRTSRGYCHAV
jgi:hypothetical protein